MSRFSFRHPRAFTGGRSDAPLVGNRRAVRRQLTAVSVRPPAPSLAAAGCRRSGRTTTHAVFPRGAATPRHPLRRTSHRVAGRCPLRTSACATERAVARRGEPHPSPPRRRACQRGYSARPPGTASNPHGGTRRTVGDRRPARLPRPERRARCMRQVSSARGAAHESAADRRSSGAPASRARCVARHHAARHDCPSGCRALAPPRFRQRA
jgi:hypothetical protein